MTPGIQAGDRGETHISGAASLEDIASNAIVRSSYPLLALAASLDAAMLIGASLAGSVVPHDGCKSAASGMTCALSGTSVCAAKEPSADLHAILDGGPCWQSFTSLTGVALHALDAVVEAGDSEATVQRVRLPADSAYGFQLFIQAPQGGPRGIAAISVAAVRRTDGDVRLVLGGVSPRPYRVYTSVEEEAMAGGLDDETIAGLAERALLDAEINPASSGKADAAATLLRRAIAQIAANSS